MSRVCPILISKTPVCQGQASNLGPRDVDVTSSVSLRDTTSEGLYLSRRLFYNTPLRSFYELCKSTLFLSVLQFKSLVVTSKSYGLCGRRGHQTSSVTRDVDQMDRDVGGGPTRTRLVKGTTREPRIWIIYLLSRSPKNSQDFRTSRSGPDLRRPPASDLRLLTTTEKLT